MEVASRPVTESDELSNDPPCDPCKINEEHHNAQHYCTMCSEFLCECCAGVHHRSKATKHHQMLSHDEMPRETLGPVKERFCSTHENRPIEYICEIHSAFCCAVCFALSHSQCLVKSIDDIAKEFNKSKDYQDLLKKIKDVQEQLSGIRNKAQSNCKDAANIYDQLMVDVQELKNEINTRRDNLEKVLVREAKTIMEDDMNSMETMLTECETIEEDLKTMTSSMAILEQNKQSQEFVIYAKKAFIKVIGYQENLTEMSKSNAVSKYFFKCNEEILTVLNELNKLGLQMKENEDETKPDTRDNRNEIPVVEASIVKEIDIQNNHLDSNSCWITGVDLMPNDMLATVDWDNPSVKIVDLNSGKISTYFKLENHPYDIACIDEKTLVVTSDTELTLLSFANSWLLSKTLSVTKKVPMEPGCRGISVHEDQLFLTCSGDLPAVKILNKNGYVIQTITHNEKGKQLFVDPVYITLSSDGQTIYVSDADQQSVISLTMEGEVCNVFKHENLSRPRGLAVDENGCIFVAGIGSKNIHRITAHCTPIQILLDDDSSIESPQALCYSATTNTLYVGKYGYTRNLLYVVKLESKVETDTMAK